MVLMGRRLTQNEEHGRLIRSITIVVWFCALFSIFKSVQYDGPLRLIAMLPCVYVISFWRLKNYLMRFRPGIITLNIILFLRYVIMPVTIFDETDAGALSQITHLSDALCLMIYEEICVFATIFWVSRKLDRKITLQAKAVHICTNTFFFYVCVVVFVVLCFLYPALIGSWGAFTGEFEMEELEAVTNTNGVIRIVFGLLEAVIALWVIDWCRYKYGKRASNLYPLIATVTVIAYLLLIQMGSVRISRWQLVVCGAAMFALLVSFFPRNKKLFVFTLLLPSCLIILFVTGVKNLGYDLAGEQEISVKGDLSNAYFAGPYNVSAAISLAEREQADRVPLWNDLLYGLPGISRTIGYKGTSSYLFNKVYYGDNRHNDAIIPLIGQSYYYFGPILSPILSVLIVFFLLIYDKKYVTTANDDSRKYIYAYIAIWLGIQSILNVTICMSWVYQRVIPLVIILWMFAPRVKTRVLY